MSPETLAGVGVEVDQRLQFELLLVGLRRTMSCLTESKVRNRMTPPPRPLMAFLLPGGSVLDIIMPWLDRQ